MTQTRKALALYPRSSCSCKVCVNNCRWMPGFLIPEDLPALSGSDRAEEVLRWAEGHLLASPGALVSKGPETFRIRTLVPSRGSDGHSCHWLENGLCQVHAHAPAGCAFFDCKDSVGPVEAISAAFLSIVHKAWIRGDLYASVWLHLEELGKIAPGPEVCRKLLWENP